MNELKKSTWFPLAVVFAAVYFFSMNGLGALPGLAISFLLKEKIALTPAELAYFQAITLIAWVIKPLWGVISDLYPIFGSRRKAYLILMSFIAAGAWCCLALTAEFTAWILLIFITLAYMAYAFQDVVADGLMVETGQALNMTGQFQSIQWTSVYIAMIITALVGGWIAGLAQKGQLTYSLIFGITAVFPILTAIIAAFLIREPSRAHLEQEAKIGLSEIFRHKGIWVLASFLFLWNFSPSFGAPFFYYLVDGLKFTPSFLGVLQAVASLGGLLGSVLYGIFFARIGIRKFLKIAVLTGVFATFSYFVYFIPWLVVHVKALQVLALTMNFILGTASAVIFLTLLNLAAKTSPQYAGGTVFALLMSFFNLGQMGSSALGGFLFPIIGLIPLIIVSGIFSFFVYFLIPYLPIQASGR